MIERVQFLDELGSEFARVAADAEQTSYKRSVSTRHGRRARTLAGALGLAVLLSGVAYAVPAPGTAADGVAESLPAWVSGDSDDAPGRALEPPDNVPSWFSSGGDARLIAKTHGVGLYARRSDSAEGPRLEVGLGEGVGLIVDGSLESWRERFERDSVHVLGTALFGPRDVLDEQGRSPLLGLTTRDVKRVELRYADGPPLVGDAGDGGFVLLADAWRPLRELIAYGITGRVL